MTDITSEMKQVQFNELISDMASLMEERGCRKVLLAFKESFPDMFHEVLTQIHRLEQKPIARLLDKNANSV